MTAGPPERAGNTGRTGSCCREPSAGVREEEFAQSVASAAQLQLGDFFFLDQAEVAADVKPEMPREESGHPLDVKRPVGLVRTSVRRTLHDPDLARTAISVIESPAVVHGHEVVSPTVYEEEWPRLHRAHPRTRTPFPH